MTLRVRKVDETGDMIFGRSQADVWRDAPEGVAQIVASRLHLKQAEWFLDTSDGTPWRTQVFGKRTEGTRDIVIRSRILGTPDVKSIVSYSSLLDRETRAFTPSATIETAYGLATLSEPL